MENRGSITNIVLIVFLILAIGGGIYIYTEIDSSMFDRFFSEVKQKEREIKRLRKDFPDSIGSYILYERNPDKIRVTSECEKIEDYPDTRDFGIKGEVCSKTITGQYRDTSSDKVVFVHLNIITKGEDISNAIYEKFSKPDILSGYNVFRIERHEVGWKPLRDFDTVITQEGQWKIGVDGSESFSYREIATGNNPVTQYFLAEFPPTIYSPKETQDSPATLRPTTDSNESKIDALPNLIARDYENCFKSSQTGVNAQKLCAEIKHLQENGRSAYFWVGRESAIKKPDEGSDAIARVDIDIAFLGTTENYNQFAQNPNRIQLLSKSMAGGTLIQMNSARVAVDTFNKILSSAIVYPAAKQRGLTRL
jgi:hypothetical protein